MALLYTPPPPGENACSDMTERGGGRVDIGDSVCAPGGIGMSVGQGNLLLSFKCCSNILY